MNQSVQLNSDDTYKTNLIYQTIIKKEMTIKDYLKELIASTMQVAKG